jgi:hypothetical protein
MYFIFPPIETLVRKSARHQTNRSNAFNEVDFIHKRIFHKPFLGAGGNGKFGGEIQ